MVGSNALLRSYLMPTYVYECIKCKERSEWNVPLSHRDNLHPKCKKCKKFSMKIIIAPTSFILKGPGWAKDGYSNGK
jgi:putative FmdB family regulatory protein